MKDAHLEGAGADHAPIDERAIHVRERGYGKSEKGGLDVHDVVERSIAFVDARGGAGRPLQLGRAAERADGHRLDVHELRLACAPRRSAGVSESTCQLLRAERRWTCALRDVRG